MPTKATFAAGRNIAIKVPPHRNDATVRFYRETAAGELAAAGVVRCDDIEPLPVSTQASWVASPASIVHLVCKDSE